VDIDIFSGMRTSIEISNGLMGQVKRRAADKEAPLRKVFEEALGFYVGKPPGN
jgi:hypothetical protein